MCWRLGRLGHLHSICQSWKSWMGRKLTSNDQSLRLGRRVTCCRRQARHGSGGDKQVLASKSLAKGDLAIPSSIQVAREAFVSACSRLLDVHAAHHQSAGVAAWMRLAGRSVHASVPLRLFCSRSSNRDPYRSPGNPVRTPLVSDRPA